MLEMITVIAIMGIVSAVAIPFIISYAKSYRIRSAASDLISNMKNAQMKAVSEGVNWRIDFNISSPTLTSYQLLCFNSTTNTYTAPYSGNAVNLSQRYPGVELNQTATNCSNVTFYPDGTNFNNNSAANSCTVMLNNSSCSADITVTAPGCSINMAAMICR